MCSPSGSEEGNDGINAMKQSMKETQDKVNSRQTGSIVFQFDIFIPCRDRLQRNNFVNLEFETLEENTLLQILDINGRRVRTFDLKAGVETLRIDLGDLPKGVYTVMLGNTTKKLIVE